MIIHATCVAIDGLGVLLRGKSGTGKSDLAIRLIENGGQLVSDDQVILTVKENRIFASPPAALAGLLEVRGIGICEYDFLNECPVCAILDLKPGYQPERMPETEDLQIELHGVKVARFQLDPFHCSTAAKIKALAKISNSIVVNERLT